MKVYIELVIINNLVIDFALIMLTRYVLKLSGGKIRLIIATILGAAIATLYPLADNVFKILINIMLAPALSLIFAKYSTIKEYILSTLMFALLTFSLGGIALAVLNLTGIDIASLWVTSVTLVSLAFLAYMARQFMALKKKRQRRIEVSSAELEMYGEILRIGALYDSGNQLVDQSSGKPVVVLSRRVGERYLNKSQRTISVKTVGGSVELPLLFAKRLSVKVKDDNVDVINFIVAVANENYNGFDLILHESFADICENGGL